MELFAESVFEIGPEGLRAIGAYEGIFLSDLSTFDNFAAIQELVPGSVHYLDGASLLAHPAVPREVPAAAPL